jgi:hypothetical protein
MLNTRLNNKYIKKIILYIVIGYLSIEIIKIRTPNNYNYSNIKMTENYKNYELTENNLYKNIRDISKQQKILTHDLINHTKHLKIKQINFADSLYGNIIFNNSSYLNNMNRVNLYARNFKNIEDAKIKYINDSIDNITDNEKEAYLWFIETLLDKVKNNSIVYNFIKYYIFNKNNKNKVIIAKSANWLEYNMPHTHKNVIFLTSNWFNDVLNKYKKDLAESLLLNEGMTFIHELIHIHQRHNMNLYETILYDKWGFIKADYIHNINQYIYMNRINPDGRKLDWIWYVNKKYYLIGALFKTEKPFSLTSVSYKLIEINKTDKDVFNYAANNINNNTEISLSSSDLFMNYFGITNNHYHPNEITAQYMEYYLEGILGYKTMYDKYGGYKIFKSNIEKILSI